jgi:NhaA family Na+:H+ antiporter
MKTDRGAALLLMSAALLGLVLANSPLGDFLLSVKDTYIEIPWLDIRLTVAYWTKDLFLAVFFLVAGLELKYELRLGVMSKLSTALVPVLAGVGGIILPAAIYIAFNWNTPYLVGWPIPTATDIAFALGLLAIFGRGMPRQARVFLLALAIFDDLVAILVIAFFYTQDLQLEWLLAAALVAGMHTLAERQRRIPINLIRVITFLLLWYAVFQSGVHATIAGVILGLIIPAKRTHALVEKIQPWSNSVALPVFAFFAVAIVLPEFNGTVSNVFLGIAIALPLGKAVGITLLALVAQRIAAPENRLPLGWVDFLAMGLLAGVGFTVSLLMAGLAFEEVPYILAEATLAVVLGSLISMTLGGWVTGMRVRHLRKQAT